MMYMGEYNHTIDAKGRLIVPSKFRESLGDEFVVTKGLDGCLYIFDEEEWSVLQAKFKAFPLSDKEARFFARFMLAGAAGLEVDKQGRILIPAVLRDFAGITKDVTLVGVGTRIEIWDTSRYADVNTFEDMDAVAEHLTALGLSI